LYTGIVELVVSLYHCTIWFTAAAQPGLPVDVPIGFHWVILKNAMTYKYPSPNDRIPSNARRVAVSMTHGIFSRSIPQEEGSTENLLLCTVVVKRIISSATTLDVKYVQNCVNQGLQGTPVIPGKRPEHTFQKKHCQ
jgi:hypothetical protein